MRFVCGLLVAVASVGIAPSARAQSTPAPAGDTPAPVGETSPAGKTGDSAAGGPTFGPPSPEPPPPPPPPPPPGPSPAEEALKADVTALKDSLEEISAELHTEREQRAEEVIGLREQAEKAEAARHAGLKLTGFAQADWTMWRQSSTDQINYSTGDPLNEERFMIRRARLRAAFDREYTGGALELDGNTTRGTTARLVGAEASLKLPGETPELPLLMGSIGLFKIPFGYEVLQSDRDRLFLERSSAERGLFPGEYDLGARLQGGWRFVRYAIALQNGNPLGDKTFPGRDPNSAKDLAGRLGIDTPVTEKVRVSGGFSALSGTGFHPGTAATKPGVQWVDRNENQVIDPSELVSVPGKTATASANFARFGYGADLQLAADLPNVGTTVVYGEVYWAKNLDRGILVADPIGLGRDYREFGGYGALTQDVGPYAIVGARFDYYRSNLDSTNQTKGFMVPASNALQTLALVLAARTMGGRVTLEFDLNGNHNGRDANGSPTNLKDDALTLRGQWSF